MKKASNWFKENPLYSALITLLIAAAMGVASQTISASNYNAAQTVKNEQFAKTGVELENFKKEVKETYVTISTWEQAKQYFDAQFENIKTLIESRKDKR